MLKSFAKLSLVFTLISFIFLLIGVTTKYWLLHHDTHYGIWHEGDPGSLQAVKVLEIIPIFGCAFNVILLSYYIRREDGQTNLTRIRLAVLFTLLSAILCVAGVIVYAARVQECDRCIHSKLGWSYILTAIAGGLLACIVLPLAVEIKQSHVLGSYESI